MLMQLHHQFKNGTTEMCAQREIDPCHSQKELSAFLKDTEKSHPLPENATWMICNEKSEHFVMMEDA